MKKIRKISSNPVFLILSVASFLFASCSKDTNELGESLNDSSSKISGEELFRSIIFIDGILTDKLSSLKSASNIVVRLFIIG